MATDRELLGAAKAAGYRVCGDLHPDDGLNLLINDRVCLWRPRRDGNDALRLAVDCGLKIDTAAVFDVLLGVEISSDEFPQTYCEQYGDDMFAAVCRTIVRAAAAMAATPAGEQEG